MTTFVVVLSIGLQLTAAVWAIRLIRFTGRRSAWYLISAALLLMAFRRMVALYVLFGNGGGFALEINEIIDLAISFLMFFGVLFIDGYFRHGRQAERALLENERRHRLMVQYLKDIAIIFLDPVGHVASWTAGAERIIGYAESDTMGRHFTMFVPGNTDGTGTADDWLRRAAAGEEVQVEVRPTRPNGTPYWAEILLASVHDAGSSVEGFVMIVRDVTDRKIAHERSILVRRMESTATVVGGLAHEFSNILNNVMGFATLIKKYIHDHGRVLKYSQAIEQSVRRGDEVTQRLLAFARIEERSPEPVAIGPLLDEVTECIHGDPAGRQSELILLVDDEQGMLEFGRDILAEHGYRVMTAGDGTEALAIYKEHHPEISLVILDLILPGMDGGQTYVAMKRINKNLKAMFCSGYNSDEIISSLLQEEHLRAVRKPFQIAEFLSAVRESLDAPRP